MPRTAREHVEHVEDAAALRAEELRELLRVDPGYRDERADAEYH
jgi:hypothetical protein